MSKEKQNNINCEVSNCNHNNEKGKCTLENVCSSYNI